MNEKRAMVLGGVLFAAFVVRAIAGCAAAPSSADEVNADDLSAATDAGDAGGPHCHNPRLHAADGTKGPFCPFQAPHSSSTCAVGEHCCMPAGSSSVTTCSANACTFPVADAGTSFDSDFQCDAKSECPSGQVCCLLGELAPSMTAGCNELVGTKVRGSVCRTSCGTNEPVICSQASECTQGTCTPFYTRGKELGACK